MSSQPAIGIDFGTTTSSAAWYNPRSGQAEILLNAEGESKTPSLVYFGDDATLVGGPAEQMLQFPDDRKRVVASIKRNLVQTPLLWLAGKPVKAIEVGAAILQKLRQDAEDLHFHEPVQRAVITCPASFNVLQREKIAEAARQAGFEEVELLEEPLAAALAYAHAGLTIGERVLVYDLGGGTFDVAVLVRQNGSWRLELPPKGLDHCGGDDFDRALYDYCEERAHAETGGSISQQGLVDLSFLRLCRQRKEHLSSVEETMFSTLVQLNGRAVPFRQTIDRSTFESLIADRVHMTVRMTREMVEEVRTSGEAADTVVLVGGSSRVPMVGRLLQGMLPVPPRRWQYQDVAVALGAAYRAHGLWKGSAGVKVVPDRLEQLYQEGRHQYADRRWDEAIATFGRLLDEQPDYRDAATLLKEAQRQRERAQRYEQGQRAMSRQAWDEAITHLRAILADVPAGATYRDARALLAQAERKLASIGKAQPQETAPRLKAVRPTLTPMQRRGFLLLGSVLFAVGVFCPFDYSATGPHSFAADAEPFGGFLLVVAITGGVLALLPWERTAVRRTARILGALSLACFLTFLAAAVIILHGISQYHAYEGYTEWLGWGMILLVLGPGLYMWAAFSRSTTEGSRSTVQASPGQGDEE